MVSKTSSDASSSATRSLLPVAWAALIAARSSFRFVCSMSCPLGLWCGVAPYSVPWRGMLYAATPELARLCMSCVPPWPCIQHAVPSWSPCLAASQGGEVSGTMRAIVRVVPLGCGGLGGVCYRSDYRGERLYGAALRTVSWMVGSVPLSCGAVDTDHKVRGV